jgi:hypothetical protein
MTFINRMSTIQHLAPQTFLPLAHAMIYVDLPIRSLFTIIYLVFVDSHILQTVASSSLTIPVIFTLTSRPKGFLRGLDTLAENGVFDEAEIGGQNFFIDFVYDCDGVFGVRGEGAYLAPVAGGALFFEVLDNV